MIQKTSSIPQKTLAGAVVSPLSKILHVNSSEKLKLAWLSERKMRIVDTGEWLPKFY